MIGDQSDFKVKIQRLSVIIIKKSYQWICNHPFLLLFFGFLYFLHRACPFLFTQLVYAFPVLICTLVLLGTILSFGEPNIPEIRKEQENFHETTLFRTEVPGDDVVERDDKSFTVRRFISTEDGNDDVVKLRENQFSEVEDDGRSFDYTPLVHETLDEIKHDTHVRFDEKAFDLELKKRGDRLMERLIENGGKQVSSAEQSGKNGGSFIDDSKEDHMDGSPISPWRPMRHGEDENDDADRDDSLDSESDGAESSSPDPSKADIIPMLGELHPLLLSDTQGIADGEGSDASSEGPHRSSSSDEVESDVDSESNGEEGETENEEEEEKKEEKEDESKSAIKWTEVDQKNVMDLGSLELERNQRLENLVAKRRARHNMRLMAEKNLIDFDSADVSFNMPSISTARQNPSDISYDSYNDMGLPPIPGSAPSNMFVKKNSFDIQYEPNEEKSDLKGDCEEELSSQQSKDSVFRRHESFSVGSSTVGGPNHDRLRPFFVLERLANEGTSYYPFERQINEVSKTKLNGEDSSDIDSTISQKEETIPHISENEVTSVSKQKINHHEESNTSFGELEIHVAREVEDDYHHDEASIEASFITAHTSDEESAIHVHVEPVYDSSTLSASKFSSLSSVSSDNKPDLPEKNGEKVQENADKECEVYSDSMDPVEIHSTSNETETRTKEVGETSTHITVEDIANVGIDGQNNTTVSGSEFEDALLDPSAIPLDKIDNVQHQSDDLLHVSCQEDMEEVHQDVKEAVEELPDGVHDIVETSVNISVGEGIMHDEDEAIPKTFHADNYSTLSSGAVEYVETHSFNDGDVPRSEQDLVQSPVSDAEEESHPNQNTDIEIAL